MVRLNADQRTDSRNSRQVLCNKKPAIWPAFFCPAEALLYRLPKVISEMVGQTCRFAATTRRSSSTISEISFGSHSNPPPGNPGVLENQSLLTSAATILWTRLKILIRPDGGLLFAESNRAYGR